MIRTLRISHPAFFGIKSAETLRFYTEALGMELVLRQPNLDDASMEHLFFHVGEDNFIAYFLPYDEEAAAKKYERMKPGYGVMNHLAIDVDAAAFKESACASAGRGRARERSNRSGIRAVDLLPRPQRRPDRAADVANTTSVRVAAGPHH